MFIRATTTRPSTTGEIYITHRLVESRRLGGQVRQVTLLNLGRQFPLAKERWPEVCARIEHVTGLADHRASVSPISVRPLHS